MNKQNKLLLRVIKTALRVAEAAKKMEDSKLENKYGTSRRPMDKHYDLFDNDPFPEPPSGKNLNTDEHFAQEIEKLFASKGERIIYNGAPSMEKVLSRNERQIRDFAGDDLAHVEELLRKKFTTAGTVKDFYDLSKEYGSTLVHCKSPELGTETLVALSPEGEVLLRIVKDNSRKFAVR